jgi:dolichol-phosphate mannosyltransferase
MTRTLILIPTYNERDNVLKICGEIIALGLGADLLFVDDNSPDGTGETLDQLAAQHECVSVLHRPEKLGLGTAHQAGIAWAYDRGYETLVTMDCDFTHQPSSIPDFLAAAPDYDVVVGSRYMNEESLRDWNIYRLSMTWLGHILTTRFLKMPYDATGAFRLYDLVSVPREIFRLVESKGYSFFFESLYVIYRNGYRIREIPIVLPKRTYGTSKMRTRDAVQSLKRLFSLFLRKQFRRDSILASASRRSN